MNPTFYSENDYRLYHHGILGMKWGIRRYQNKDGTLTNAGKQRYGTSQVNASKMSRADKKTIDKNLNIVGKNTKKVDAKLQKKVAELDEYKAYSEYKSILQKAYLQAQKERPGVDVVVPKDILEGYRVLQNNLNYAVSKLITENISEYASAKLKDMGVEETDQTRAYIEKQLLEKRVI